MSAPLVPRRDALKSILAAIPVALDWSALPVAKAAQQESGEFDAVIIGSGLGGLACAAGFARQGFRSLVLEQHDKPGGYATAFKRPGGFLFDVSLHTTHAAVRDGIHNLIPGMPEITDVEFVPLPSVYRAIYPQHDIRVPGRDFTAYLDSLYTKFPAEKDGIKALHEDMAGVASDVQKYVAARGKVDMSQFPVEFPHLMRSAGLTWGEMMDTRIHDPELKAIVSALWVYYGLPPSKLASMYYAMPTIGGLKEGGYYPKNGRSQTISDAFVKFVEGHGGKVLLNTRVEAILTKDHAAYGVRAGGQEYKAKVVVSNANAYDTFHKLLEPDDALRDYIGRMDRYTTSLSTFQIFLGLKNDLVKRNGLKDAEIFYYPSYDVERAYRAALEADVANSGLAVMAYDTLYPGYSPRGKNTVTLLALQGFDPWKRFEKDYFAGSKKAYNAEKERIANLLIRQADRTILPGLAKSIEVKEIGTPLTNVRYTGNHRGAIYGWDQTLDNSGMRRQPHRTPIKNLYLAGAWTQPGGGYGAVIASGLQCFGEVMKTWG